MKKIIQLFTFAFIFASASAAVPLHWTVETSRAVTAQFEAYQGETLTFEAALQSYGKPLEAPSNYSLYWQTNGMGNAWWTKNCTPSSTSTSNLNLMVATWSPTNDVGAKVYNCFIGKPGTIYHAAFQLRLRPSPGALPNELPLPTPVIDFAKVTVLNPPWSGGGGGGGVDTNAVIDIANATIETNDTVKSLLSSVSGLQALKADKTNTYTRAETDAKIGEKRDKADAAVWEDAPFDYYTDSTGRIFMRTSATSSSYDGGDGFVLDYGYPSPYGDGPIWRYTENGFRDYEMTEDGKNNPSAPSISFTYGQTFIRHAAGTLVQVSRSFVHAPDATTSGIAAFDGKGKLKAATAGTDYATPGQLDGKLSVVDDDGSKVVTEIVRFRESTHLQSYLYLPSWSYLTDGLDGLPDYLASGEWNTDEDDPFAKVSQLPVISATDTAFSNAVDQIVRSLIPTKLRAYDPVRQCWWNIQPVNGVLTLTVED